ncbi:NAD(P)/FAD-dependent oxidoreductase [Amycolatopsis regifaucium]|uniref:FAD-dependent oxidoreductase n=1 Tax=Amycolatopsis regifaucium TaxID=546365 RepID=A0A154MWK8_9PSEU|nr:FAD-dependent oxidoreductase [Amycolatopsis regifaucium]KZB88655.1 FAD-dependent oxidoreductase [Amycolatopsis regifaucium]OKA07175.1 FAD-dependent oxidoreductase [Amycolatopsis regifaucium]SFI55255.1 Glycine/D-amino acid oxidase [Amycolatopsis regifaucium]
MNRTRVVVLGAGIVGAACARELSLAGFDVVVVDRGRPAGGTTSHGEGNVLVSDKGPGAELELAKLSALLWPRVVAEIADEDARAASAIEYDPKGGIVVATTGEGARALAAFAETQTGAGVRAEPLSHKELAEVEPALTREVTTAFRYPEDAQVQPAGAALALLGSALRHGARLRSGTEVVGAVVRDGSITGVRVPGEVIEADVVVNAAGPWAGQVSARLGAPIAIRPRRGEVLVTTPMPGVVRHKVYDADYVGAVGADSGDLQTSAVVESTWGGTVLIGSSRRRVGFDDAIRPDVLSAIAVKALRLFPALADAAVMRAYGGFRPYVDDHLPVLGEDPRLGNLWHATGHEGAGIGLSVGTARLLRELLTGTEPAMGVEEFTVDRPAVLAGVAA